jgi:hypothetical protein
VSYDLYAIAARPDEDPAEVYEALGEAEDGEAAGWTDEQVARAEKLAASLQALNPRLERFVFDYPKVAKALGVTGDEARAQWRHIELNTPDGGNPIQVTIHADHASLTMPYWYTGERAKETIREALSYLAVIERETGWTTFDPQIGRRLDLRGDLNEVVSAYEVGSRRVEELSRERSPSPESPPAKRKRRFWPW